MQINRKLQKQKALFIDRDGVINDMVKYNKTEMFDSPQTPNDIKITKKIDSVIRWANKNKILVIEISNQPGVAKGKMDQNTSNAIEAKIHKLLKDKQAAIDYKYICPHHPKGVIPKLTKNCRCRKPKPGLLLKASKDLNIDLSDSIFLGDLATDIEAGKKAGCKTILFKHTNNLPDKIHKAYNSNPDFISTNHKQTLLIIKKFFS